MRLDAKNKTMVRYSWQLRRSLYSRYLRKMSMVHKTYIDSLTWLNAEEVLKRQGRFSLTLFVSILAVSVKLKM